MDWLTERYRKWRQGEYIYNKDCQGVAHHKLHWTSKAAHWAYDHKEGLKTFFAIAAAIATIFSALF